MKKVRTKRKLIHVSSRRNRKSILENGIRAGSNNYLGYSNMVFAHNSYVITPNWYPLIFNAVEFEIAYDHCFKKGKDVFFYFIENYLDFWEIDSVSLNRSWYLDELGDKEFRHYGENGENLFVRTFGSICSSHIQLIPTNELRIKYYKEIELFSTIDYEVVLRDEEEPIDEYNVIGSLKYLSHGLIKQFFKDAA